MKQKMIMTAFACLLLSAVSVFAQTKTDFSGTWTLDVSKSKLDERARIESGMMTVAQSANDLTFSNDFKRAPRPEGAAAGNGQGNGGGMGRGGMGGGMMGGANMKWTYTLDGKETSMDVPTQQGSTSAVKLKSEWDGGKLKLVSTRTLNTQMGEATVTTKETWETADGGKTLKVKRETETPRGTQTSEFYYTKN